MTYFHKEIIHQLKKKTDIHFKTILFTSRLRSKQTICTKNWNVYKFFFKRENLSFSSEFSKTWPESHRGEYGCHFLAVTILRFLECPGIKTGFSRKVALVLHYTLKFMKGLKCHFQFACSAAFLASARIPERLQHEGKSDKENRDIKLNKNKRRHTHCSKKCE